MILYARNTTDAPVCAIAPGQSSTVDPAHRAVAAALAAGELVPSEEPTPVSGLRAENARLKVRVAELERLLERATDPANPEGD